MIREVLVGAVESLGFEVTRVQQFDRRDHGRIRAPAAPKLRIGRHVAEEIIEFFQVIPPFYDADTPEPLRIGGAWRQDLLNRRRGQLHAIERADVDGYDGLLNDMFRNELVFGLWTFGYYEPKLAGKRFPSGFLRALDGFTFLTGRSADELASNDAGNGWGCPTSAGIVKFTDPAQGMKAQNIVDILDAVSGDGSVPTLVDLGSGFGGDVEKVMRWYGRPLRAILIDIPCNLTTAYAYLKTALPDSSHHLVTTREELRRRLGRPPEQAEVLFAPSLFVGELEGRPITVLHNSGSFSEMDLDTIEFYLQKLIGPETAFFLETNSDLDVANTGGHVEVRSSRFPVPRTHRRIYHGPVWSTPGGHRYVFNLYVNRDSFGRQGAP